MAIYALCNLVIKSVLTCIWLYFSRGNKLSYRNYTLLVLCVGEQEKITNIEKAV